MSPCSLFFLPPPCFDCFRWMLIGGLIGRIWLAGCISLVLTGTGSGHQDKQSQSHPLPSVIVCFCLKSWLYILDFYLVIGVLPRKYVSDAAPVGVLNSFQLLFCLVYAFEEVFAGERYAHDAGFLVQCRFYKQKKVVHSTYSQLLLTFWSYHCDIFIVTRLSVFWFGKKLHITSYPPDLYFFFLMHSNAPLLPPSVWVLHQVLSRRGPMCCLFWCVCVFVVDDCSPLFKLLSVFSLPHCHRFSILI